jgi:hypothetical protein
MDGVDGPRGRAGVCGRRQRLLQRSGPRIVDSLELLAALLHPGRFPNQAARLGGTAMRIGPDLEVLPATTT